MNITNNIIVQKKIKELPLSPGVYLYRNLAGRVIYVGKAVNLKNRVTSYFSGEHDIKTDELVKNIADLEWIVTGSEIEALILESELVKRYKPKFNIDLKDDKGHCYIKITKELYPSVSVVRQITDAKAEYIGPYLDSNAVRNSLKYLRKIFPYCNCSVSSDRICLYYHLGLCPGHGEKFITPAAYQKNIKGLKRFFSGKKESILTELKKEMKLLSAKKEFERAAEARDKIIALERLRFEHVIEEKRELKLDVALSRLQEALNLKKLPVRIECYDISNIMGVAPVGSMVVFEGGIPKRSDYRRFEIKGVKGINDFAMHQEVARRRFSRLSEGKDKSFNSIPDLVIIDGGKGQLSAVTEIVSGLNLPTKFVGLAKRYEEVIVIDHGEFKTINLKEDSDEYMLIQRIRDEAHRFAITYHRNIRSKELTVSVLDSIDGVGPVRKKKLIKKFGSIEKIKESSTEELAKEVGEALAKKIKEVL